MVVEETWPFLSQSLLTFLMSSKLLYVEMIHPFNLYNQIM